MRKIEKVQVVYKTARLRQLVGTKGGMCGVFLSARTWEVYCLERILKPE